MAALREILAEFGIEFDKEGNLAKGDKAVDGMVDKLKDFGKAVAGAFAIDALVGFARQTIDAADAIGETAERLDVSTQSLQEWVYAAKLSGVEQQNLVAAIARVGASVDAGAAKFKKLGVATKDSNGNVRSAADVFADTAAAIAGIENPAEQAAAASEIFGKQYATLLPLLRQGPEGLAKLRQEFAELGGGFGEDFIKQSAEFNDNIDKVSFGLQTLAQEVLAPLMPHAM